MASWLDVMANPKGHALKRVMFQLLQERYTRNEPIVDRLGSALMTESDYQGFMKLLTDVYEAGYMKSVADHSEQLKKAGLVARVVPPGQA